MVKYSDGQDVIRRLVKAAWSADVGLADPDEPQVQGFAEFGLSPLSELSWDDKLRQLKAWRDRLKIPANSAFLDGTLLLTVEALLGPYGPDVLTPVTLWELTSFIDALVCFDWLYCIENPAIDAAYFNQQLGADVLRVIPDPDRGILRQLAAQAASKGIIEMQSLRMEARRNQAFSQEMQAVVDGWRAVLGQKFPKYGPFNTEGLPTPEEWQIEPARVRLAPSGSPLGIASPARAHRVLRKDWSAFFIDGEAAATGDKPIDLEPLRILIEATRLPHTPESQIDRPPQKARLHLAANATYRTYVNQGIANTLALPYLPGTLRMPFRRLFVERAAQVQDELVTVALADQVFAQQQPSSPLILPFFTAAVLQRATTREDVWAQMARVREQSATFRRKRADLDRILQRSQVSAEATRVQRAIRDEALNLADLAGAAQESTSVALGVVAQTGIVPLTQALKVVVDAAHGISRGGSWARIWRKLFHRHEYFLAQTNSQAIALTNALPQLQQLWEMPKIGGYLNRFARATQQIGHVLRS